MLNQVVLVGRIVEDIKIEDEIAIVKIGVPRSYKNINGEYDTDFIEITLWPDISKNVCEYCKKGDLIGIKGRVQSKEIKGEEKCYKMEIIAEKVTFLSSKKPSEENEEYNMAEQKITRLKKLKKGFSYKYTELAQINEYCEENNIDYYQEIETCELNQKDYIVTYVKFENDEKYEKHRGCQIVDSVLSGIKNPVQEYGSSLTYCRRYSLLMALGLATEDDDGAVCGKQVPKNSDDKLKALAQLENLLLGNDEDREKIYTHYGVNSTSNLNEKQMQESIKLLVAKQKKIPSIDDIIGE